MYLDNLSKDNKKIWLALAGLMFRGTLADLCNVLSIGFLEPIINAIAISVFLFSISVLFKSISKIVIISTVFFLILWISSYVIYPSNIPYLTENFVQFFIYCLPFFWLGYYFIKERIYLSYLLPIAKIKLILALTVQVLIFINPSVDIFKGDYQTAAYSIVVGLIAVYYLALHYKKIEDIILSITGTIILLLVGSRGIFLSLIYFWAMYFISTTKMKKIPILIISTAIIFALVDYKELLLSIDSIAQTLGFSTHLTEALLSGEFFNDESRENLYTNFIVSAWKEPWGYGIMGDRHISFATGFFWKPIYPHNIFIELLVQFGYIGGTIISVGLIYVLFRSQLFQKKIDIKMTVLVISSTTIIKLLFASSFWTDQMFFMLLGVLYALSTRKIQLII